MRYFRDMKNGSIVRKSEDGTVCEFISQANLLWQKVLPGSVYEREYCSAEGADSLCELGEKSAQKIIAAWRNSSSSSDMAVSLEYQQLKQRADRLRTEISMLLLEHDELRFVICKNIETAYMLVLGSLEHKAFEAQCTFLRLKRKLELIQSGINRQEKICISKIESILDEEFAEYKVKLEERINKINQAIEHSNGRMLTAEENKELKALYRKIVKCLHPDLNPNITEGQRRLFENAVEAYKNADLAMMRIIGTVVDEPDNAEKATDAISALKGDIDRLEKNLTSIHQSIADIKESYPYTVKDIVESQELTEQRKKELEAQLAQLNESILLYRTKIDELLKCTHE